MMPDRPQFMGWNLPSLLSNGSTIAADGNTVSNIGHSAYNKLHEISTARKWSGAAYNAADGAFGRMVTSSDRMQNYSTDVQKYLEQRYWALEPIQSKTRNKLAEIEGPGKLSVNSKWVVLIKPKVMSVDELLALEKEMYARQAELNDILQPLPAADSPNGIKNIAEKYGDHFPAASGPLFPGSPTPEPGDRAPDPTNPVALAFAQGDMRSQYQATTVYRIEQEELPDGKGTKTILTMQDGSQQVVTRYNDKNYPPGGYRSPYERDIRNRVTVDSYSVGGKLVSSTESWEDKFGKNTRIEYHNANGTITQVNLRESPNGHKSGTVEYGGRTAEIPPGSALLTTDQSNTIGYGLSAAETGLREGWKIPGASASSIGAVEKSLKFAGPAVVVADTAVKMYTAPSAHDSCVEGVTGAFAIAGGYGGGTLGAGGGPVLGPLTSGAGSVIGATLGGVFGKWVGEKMCGSPDSPG